VFGDQKKKEVRARTMMSEILISATLLNRAGMVLWKNATACSCMQSILHFEMVLDAEGYITMDWSVLLPVLQVLQQLPDGLAIAVLAAAQVDADHLLDILPVDLHPLVIEAAFPAIFPHRSLSLNLETESDTIPSSVYAALHAATTATSPLITLNVTCIPVCDNQRLLELILTACKSASRVALDYNRCCATNLPNLQHLEQLRKVLCQNTSITSLELSFGGGPREAFELSSLLRKITNLRNLSLDVKVPHGVPGPCLAPQCIGLLRCLTRLRFGPGVNVRELPEILPRLTKLEVLHLGTDEGLQNMPPLGALTGLKTLELANIINLSELPSFTALTALHTLHMIGCRCLEPMQYLSTFTGLQTLRLMIFEQKLPSLATLTALKAVDLSDCWRLQQLPPLDTLTALQTLQLAGCGQLQQLPPLATLTALNTLDVRSCVQLKELPPLDTLTALQTLRLAGCGHLQTLPPLATLTALQTLDLSHCRQLQQLPAVDSLTDLQTLRLSGCDRLQRAWMTLRHTHHV
jgi:hypothetical protein